MPKTYWVETYGCQMNEHDSERLAGQFEAALVAANMMAWRERTKTNIVKAVHEGRMAFRELGRRMSGAGHLIDPKQVEMGQYQRLPHLLTQPVTNPKKAANALRWAVAEMERRYRLMQAASVRHISGFNAYWDSASQEKRDELLALV